jgi:tetratricopeptide (TPR) repeat protein
MWLPVVVLLAQVPPELARERWLRLAAGPVEVVTNSGEGEARRLIQHLEQVRTALARLLGKDELLPVWPIRIVLLESPRQVAALGAPPPLALARDGYTAVVSRGPLPAALLQAFARVLIEDGTRRLPRELDEGLAALFSTAELEGSSRVVVGRPPPEYGRSWAKAHWLVAPPDHYGKLRVLIRNLEQGVPEDAAYRNAFAAAPADVDRQVESYLAGRQFGTVALSGRPFDPQKEIAVTRAERGFGLAVLADLVATARERPREARHVYEEVLRAAPSSTEALEGLGLLEFEAGEREEAGRRLAAAVAGGSLNARVHLALALLEPDAAKAQAALAQAARLNPRWARPHWEMARRETEASKRLQLLQRAASLEPRNPEYWLALAEAYREHKDFREAARAWAAAEQAAPDEASRLRIRQMRAQDEIRRKQEEEAERLRAAEEKRRELERLKEQAMASIQAALEKANQANPPSPAGGKVEPWWDDPRPRQKVEGILERVDCLGKQARLVIQSATGKPLRLLIREPSGVVVLGGGDRTLSCGPQRSSRKIRVEYVVQADSRLGTAGEALLIELFE